MAQCRIAQDTKTTCGEDEETFKSHQNFYRRKNHKTFRNPSQHGQSKNRVVRECLIVFLLNNHYNIQYFQGIDFCKECNTCLCQDRGQGDNGT